MKNRFLIIFFLIFFSKLYASDRENLDTKIFKNLRCIVCQGQSIADSNSDFAQIIKLVVKEQVKSKKSEKDIYNFLVNNYGEWIVYKPLLNRTNFILWALPYLALLFGGLIILMIFKKKGQ